MFGSVITQVAKMFCGNSPEAATCFWSGFLQSRGEAPEFSRKHDVVKLASCIVALKRGSFGKRVVCALLSSLITRREIASLADQLPEFTFSRSSFTRACEDYEVLIRGEQLTVLLRSVKRFDENTVDNAIGFLMQQENVLSVVGNSNASVRWENICVFCYFTKEKSQAHVRGAHARTTSRSSGV